MMRNLLFVSILLIFPLASRASNADWEKGLYRASFDISKNHLSGLLLIKKVTDTSYRIVFSNEIGMRFFDLEIGKAFFVNHYCFPSLDRKSLLNMLETDFRALLYPELKAFRKWEHATDPSDPTRHMIRSKGRVVSKTRISFTPDPGKAPSSILLSNPFIRLKLDLKLISP